MKIVFLLRGFVNGGVERRIVNLANGFATCGHYVEIAVFQGNCLPPAFEVDKNVSFYFFSNTVKEKIAEHRPDVSIEQDECGNNSERVFEKKSKKVHGFQWYIKRIRKHLPKGLKRIKSVRVLYDKNNIRLCNKYFSYANPDVIITLSMALLPYALAATGDLECRVYHALSNAHQKLFVSNNKQTILNLLKQTDSIVVQTKSEKVFFERDGINVALIHNPLLLDLPVEYIGERKKTIVSFCRIAPQKNLNLLIDAFMLFHSEYPEYHLCIYGNTVCDKEEKYRKKILFNISEKGLNDYVSVLPFIKDIHNTVRDCAMFVSSSDYEGLSNSMLEAMAIGLPCVCTDCLGGGTREVMVDHENGLIVPMNDPEAMYRAMKEFVDNPELAEKCSRNAAKIRDKLSVEMITQQWLDIIGR